MKLTAQQIDAVEAQTGRQPIPGDLPVMNDLLTVFGDHTFYLFPAGILVWEVAETPEGGAMRLRGVRLASWADEDKTELAQHEPVDSGHTVEIGHLGPDSAA